MARKWEKQPGKRGGADYRADPDISDDKGALTCGHCNGRGVIVREQVRADRDDNGKGYGDYDEARCPVCRGTGTVKG
ncbi:MAG: hypothetical protein IRZ08_17515 [Frankia sp.]|nr:hypothetical protein [Frankia sp.]